MLSVDSVSSVDGDLLDDGLVDWADFLSVDGLVSVDSDVSDASLWLDLSGNGGGGDADRGWVLRGLSGGHDDWVKLDDLGSSSDEGVNCVSVGSDLDSESVVDDGGLDSLGSVDKGVDGDISASLDFLFDLDDVVLYDLDLVNKFIESDLGS